MSPTDVFRRWTSISLVVRVLCGLAIGIALGLAVPGLPFIGLMGDAFVWSLRAVAPVLILMIVATSLMNRVEGLGSRFKDVISLYMTSCLTAAAIASVVFHMFPVGISVPSGEPPLPFDFDTFIRDIASNILSNPIDALADSNFLGILFWAFVVGVLAQKLFSENAKQLCYNVTGMLLRLITIFIQFAPFGVLGIIYQSLTDNGTKVFAEYGSLVLIVVSVMAVVMFVSNPLIVSLVTKGENPYPLLFKCLRGSAVTAFFTRSSAANVPVNLRLCEEMGLDKDFYTTSIPLGSAINTCGAAVTITILSLTAAYSVGIEVSLAQSVCLCIVATMCAMGSSGIAGGSILLVPLACSILGVPDDTASAMIAAGFVIGVIQDSCETALNSSSDVLFTATVDKLHKKRMKKESPTE